MAKDETWILAKDALEKYERLLGGRGAAKETLAEHLRDGTLRAMADEKWVSAEPLIKKAWKNPDERSQAERGVVLDPVLFRSSKRWLEDKSDWRWPFSKASITFRNKAVKRYMLAGLRFSTSDLTKITGAPDASLGGSPGKKENWVTYWHALIDLANSGRLNHGCFPSQASLQKELLEEYLVGLSDKTIRAPTRQVWNKYCQE